MRTAALIGLMLIGSSATACPPQQGGFKVFQALLFSDMPDLRRQGIAPAYVVDRGFWEGADQSGVADPLKVAAVIDALPRDGAPIVIDIEWAELSYNHADTAAAAKARVKIEQLRKIAGQFKEAAGNRAVGYYGIFPLSDYWRAIDTPAGGFKDWQLNNNDLSPINANIDVTFPSLYTYYQDRAGWVKQAHALVCEARRISGKPVYVFVRPEFQESTPDEGRYLPPDYWRLQLETLYQIADGVVLWGGYDVPADRRRPWDANAPWWKVTQQMMGKWRLKRPIPDSTH